jgi:hypothetical protein
MAQPGRVAQIMTPNSNSENGSAEGSGVTSWRQRGLFSISCSPSMSILCKLYKGTMFMMWKLFSAPANLSNHNSNCQLVQEKKKSTRTPWRSQNFALNFLFFYLLPVDADKVLRPYAFLSLQRCRLIMVRTSPPRHVAKSSQPH